MVVQFATRQIEPDITVMDFSGRLTLGNQLIDIEHAITDHIRQGGRQVVLELSKLDFMDSGGVGALVICSSTMKISGGKMVLAGAAGKVKQVLELTSLDRIIEMYSDVSSACEALSGTAPPPATV